MAVAEVVMVLFTTVRQVDQEVVVMVVVEMGQLVRLQALHLYKVMLVRQVQRIIQRGLAVEEAVVQELLVKVDQPMVLVPAAQEKI